MEVIRAIAVAFGMASLSLVAGCHQCSLIVQQVTWPVEDAELQPLVDACTAHIPDGASGCATMSLSTSSADSVECGCLALCQRLLVVIDQFSGSEALIGCHLPRSAPDAGPVKSISITYRPSTCP